MVRVAVVATVIGADAPGALPAGARGTRVVGGAEGDEDNYAQRQHDDRDHELLLAKPLATRSYACTSGAVDCDTCVAHRAKTRASGPPAFGTLGVESR